MDRGAIVQELQREPAVVFAILFGSRVQTSARAGSDWDIGVYLDDALDAGERARIRARLIAALEPAIRADVVVLNEAPALLSRRVLDGERLFVRDERAWVRFFVRTLGAAGDEAHWRELHARERARRLEEGRFGRP
ncbi:MAG: type VII toxin-antitoxin system MntA family adenylyltransferase antitoxin [Myxococcota bacterium]